MESTDREWGIFTIGNLFNVERGNAKDIRNNVTNGEIVLVSAIDNNNGFYKTVAARNEKVFENAITVNNNGNGVCLAYYHNYKFVASSDVTVLTPKFEVRLNRYIAYFIITVIRQQIWNLSIQAGIFQVSLRFVKYMLTEKVQVKYLI